MHLPSLDPHEHMPIGADGGQLALPRASCSRLQLQISATKVERPTK